MAERQAEAAALPLYSIISDPYSYPSMEKAAQKLHGVHPVMIEECAELLETESLADFYDEVLVRTGYLAMLEEKNDVESRTRAENVRELKIQHPQLHGKTAMRPRLRDFWRRSPSIPTLSSTTPTPMRWS